MGNDAAAKARAVAAYQSGNSAEAARLCEQILQTEPGDPEIWCVLGVAQNASGRPVDAAASYREAIRLRPGFFDAWNNLGNALVGQEKLDEAIAAFVEALRLRPEFAEAHNNLGVAFRHQGKWPEAVDHYREALRLRPQYPDALNNLGDALQAIGQFDEALASYEHALRLRPQYPEARTNLGNVLIRLGKHDEAIAQHKEALRLRPGYADAHCNLGNALSAQHGYAEAEACYRECLRLKPAYAIAYHNLGTALGEQGRLTEAEECYREAVRLKADSMDALGNLATILLDQGKAEEATTICARILEFKPDSPEAHLSRALALLAIGRWQEAWPDYEWRWRTADFGGRMPYEQPLWDGSPLEGRTVLVHAEQGLGDTFLFVRFLPLVKQRGGIVLFACPKVLLRLLRDLPGVDRLVQQGTEMPPFDCHAPLMSLPAIFGVTPETVPANIPYLSADPGLVDYWQRELPPTSKFRIGIAWQGNPGFKADRRRSMRLEEFAPLAAVEGVELYSLQKGFGSEQIRDASFPIIDLAPRLDQSTGAFLDTAAVIKNFDLVIAADTALIHLAGAMGSPAWLAQSYAPHWVWLRDREDSPWYPSVRLFRQERWGDWKGVFARMAEALREEVAAPRRSRPILLEMTPGELIDRISIHQLRSERLNDAAERAAARRQLAVLEAARDRTLPPSAELLRLTEELKSVNAHILEADEEMRQCELSGDFGGRFTALARLLRGANDRRAALKGQVGECLAGRSATL